MKSKRKSIRISFSDILREWRLGFRTESTCVKLFAFTLALMAQVLITCMVMYALTPRRPKLVSEREASLAAPQLRVSTPFQAFFDS